MHKAIANTMFARNTTGRINDGEIKMLDKALGGFVVYTTAKNQRLDRGMLADKANTGNSIVLVRQLLTYKEYALKMNKIVSQGDLAVGGIVTPVLIVAGVELKGKRKEPQWIDLEYLHNSSIIERNMVQEKHVYNFSHAKAGKAKILLPLDEFPKLHQGGEADFIPPISLLHSSTADEESDDQVLGDWMEENKEPEIYHFDDSECKSLKEANKRIGLLQQWNKFQDKAI